MKSNKKDMIEALTKHADDRIAKYRTQARLIKAIGFGLDKVRHHKQYTKRVVDAVKAAIIEEYPECEESLVVSTYGYTGNSLRIWGVPGITYDDSLRLQWHLDDWVKGLEEDMARYRCDQWIGEMQALKNHVPMLVDGELKVRALREEIVSMAQAVNSKPLPFFAKEIIPNVYDAS
jgi:hypothetical protein